MPTGKEVFVSTEGVQYVLDKYLSQKDKDDLARLNNEHSKDRFQEELIRRLERGSGSNNWIPPNYEDELVQNAMAIIPTSREARRLKNGRDVDVYETRTGRRVYEDNRGRLKDYNTVRYVKKSEFEE